MKYLPPFNFPLTAWWMWPSSYLVPGDYCFWGRNRAAEGFFLWASFLFGSGSFGLLDKHVICSVLLDSARPPRNPSVVCFLLILGLRVVISLLSLSLLLPPFGSDLTLILCSPSVGYVPHQSQLGLLNTVYWRAKWMLKQLKRGRHGPYASDAGDSLTGG